MKNISPESIRVKLGIFCFLSILAIWLIPKFDHSPNAPGYITVLGIGEVITLFTGASIYFGTRLTSIPKKLLMFTFFYNALIVAVKFVFAPLSIYKSNESYKDLYVLGWLESPLMAGVAASVVFLLYFAVFFAIYKHYKKKVVLSMAQTPSTQIKKGRKVLTFWGIALLIGLVIFISAGPLFIYPLFFGSVAFLILPAQYLFYVFTTFFGGLTALSLVGAIFFLNAAFNSAADQAIAMRDVTILVSFFWIGLGFLFIYHALWVVYFLVITSIWPLRVVLPK